MKQKQLAELGRLTTEEYRNSPKWSVTIVLDNVRSGHNVGSFFRMGDAFRVERILLCGISPTPPHNEIHKTALGAEETVLWDYYQETVEGITLLKKRGYLLWAVEQTDCSTELQSVASEPHQNVALIFGNEVRGVGQEVLNLSDRAIEIPQHGSKHSLNVSVSGGIVLWHLYQHLK